MKYETAILQDMVELGQFIELIKSEPVTRYLEIGSKHGGTLWRIGNALPKGSRIVSVDLPHGDGSFKESQPHLEACVSKLLEIGYQAYLLLGDSTDPQVIEDARKFGPYDLVFIDANHTESYVWKDWNNYGPMGRMVAFHDINWQERPMNPGKMPIHVPRVWEEIKHDYRFVEFKNCPRDNGIGVLWRS